MTFSLAVGPKTLKGLPDQQIIFAKLLDVCTDIIPQMSLALDEIDSISLIATRLTRRFAHSVAKQYRKQLSNSDLCPCLSGLTITACTGFKGD